MATVAYGNDSTDKPAADTNGGGSGDANTGGKDAASQDAGGQTDSLRNAKALGLQTTCYVSKGSEPTAERCKGSRNCGADGLGACEPLTGEAAVCQQAQCLDPTTLLPLADGTACDDGRACTTGDTCQAGVCASGQQTCPCEPGFKDCDAAAGGDAKNLCLGDPFCAETKAEADKPFACVPHHAKTKVCDGSFDDTCNKNACVPLSGACTVTAVERTEEICDLPPAKEGDPAGCRRQVLPQTAPSAAPTACDDGLPCSPGDVCIDGQCKPTSLLDCGCQNDVDCSDDGDLCNGLPYCDKSGTDDAGKPVWNCKVNPATVVSCDTSKDGSCLHTWQKIMWQRDSVTNTQAWDQSKLICDNLTLAGKSDWRLPTFVELYGLVDLHGTKPAAAKQAFVNAEVHAYTATSSIKQSEPVKFYGARLSYGTADDRKTVEEPALVRCVRDLP